MRDSGGPYRLSENSVLSLWGLSKTVHPDATVR